MHAPTRRIGHTHHRQHRGRSVRLNGRWHAPALGLFLFVAAAHLVEHVMQGVQYWVLGRAAHAAHGALGAFMPHAAASEWLHWGYNGLMLAGLVLLQAGMVGRARRWWFGALWLQSWHFLEHCLLLGQALSGWRLAGGGAPVSLGQLAVAMGRIELHMAYNWMVFLPLMLGLYFHWYPPAKESVVTPCRCAVRRLFATSTSGRDAAVLTRGRGGCAGSARTGPPVSP